MEQTPKKLLIAFAISCYEVKPGLPSKIKLWYSLHPVKQEFFWSDSRDTVFYYFTYEAAEDAIRKFSSPNESVRFCQIEKFFTIQPWTGEQQQTQPISETAPAGGSVQTEKSEQLMAHEERVKQALQSDAGGESFTLERIRTIAAHCFMAGMTRDAGSFAEMMAQFSYWWNGAGEQKALRPDLQDPVEGEY